MTEDNFALVRTATVVRAVVRLLVDIDPSDLPLTPDAQAAFRNAVTGLIGARTELDREVARRGAEAHVAALETGPRLADPPLTEFSHSD
jgi:hypothetical protein